MAGIVAEKHHTQLLDVHHDVGIGVRLVVVHDRIGQTVDHDHITILDRVVRLDD